MEQVFQTDFGPDGNCMSACLATLFELPISAVPNFYHVAGHDPEKWWNAISDWLRPHGYGLLIATVTSEYLARLDGALIVGGTSPRGVQHAVIYVDGKLWHDPHPDGGGVTDPLDVTVIYPLHGFPHPDPGGVMKRYCADRNGEHFLCNDGLWVSHSEAQAEIARLTADLAAMREACRWNHLCADEYRTGCGVNRHVPEDFCPDCGHPVEVGNESAPAAD